MSEKEFVFGVDPTIEDPGEFGSPIVFTDALYNASLGIAGVDENPYEDDWGSFYSAYSPVFDSKGDVAGIVAVDFSTDWYQCKVRQLVFIIFAFLLFALICSIILAIMITGQYNKFFVTLIDKMNDLSNGIQTLINEVETESEKDEFFSLADSDNDKDMTDSMELLGEKILIMQMRLAKHIEIIRSQAYIDGLTGLNNRTSYMEYLQILEKKIEEHPDTVFSVVLLDINQLKMINDDFGHDQGDVLIIETANKIRDVFGGNRVYRIGGDEFVAILDETDPTDKIERARGDNISIGYATYDPATDKDYSDVFHRADDAMYADKRAFYKTHEDRRKKRK